MTTLLHWLLETTLATAILATLVTALSFGLRYRPAVLHTLWVLVLLKFVSPPILPSYQVVEQFRQLEYFQPAITPQPISQSVSTVATQSSTEISLEQRWLFLGTVFSVWFVGTLTVLGWQARRTFKFGRVVSTSVPASAGLRAEVRRMSRLMRVRPIHAVTHGRVQSPFLWCFPGMRLVWPESIANGIPLRRSRVLLAHELAHVRRGDRWIAMLDLVVGAIWWWNPVYYYVRQRIMETAEMSCDAIAMQQFPNQRRNYAELFLEHSSFQKSGAPTPVLGVSVGTPSSFERRLSMIVSNRVSGKYSTAGILAIALIATLATPSWSIGGTVDKSKKKGKKAEPKRVVLYLSSEDDHSKKEAKESESHQQVTLFVTDDSQINQDDVAYFGSITTDGNLEVSDFDVYDFQPSGAEAKTRWVFESEIEYQPYTSLSSSSYKPLEMRTATITVEGQPLANAPKIVEGQHIEVSSDGEASTLLPLLSPKARKPNLFYMVGPTDDSYEEIVVKGMPLIESADTVIVRGMPLTEQNPTSEISSEIRELRKEIKSLRKDLEKIKKNR